MKLVRAGLRRDDHLAAAVVAKFSRKASRENLELLNRIDGWAKGRRAQEAVIIVISVECEIIRQLASATDIETTPKAQNRSVCGRRHLGNKQRKLKKIASVESQLDDFAVINDGADRAALCLSQRDCCSDLDRFALLADFQN